MMIFEGLGEWSQGVYLDSGLFYDFFQYSFSLVVAIISIVFYTLLLYGLYDLAES